LAKRRMLDQRVCLSAKLSEVSWPAKAIWFLILPNVDDRGNITADLKELRATVIPLGHKGKAVGIQALEDILCELESVGLIQRYEAEGKKCLHFARFNDFQTLRSDRKPVLEWPEMPDDIPRHDSDTPVVNHDMLARARETNGKETKGKEDAHTRKPEPERAAKFRDLMAGIGKPIPQAIKNDAHDQAAQERRQQ
jgi:hypothetical protein